MFERLVEVTFKVNGALTAHATLLCDKSGRSVALSLARQPSHGVGVSFHCKPSTTATLLLMRLLKKFFVNKALFLT